MCAALLSPSSETLESVPYFKISQCGVVSAWYLEGSITPIAEFRSCLSLGWMPFRLNFSPAVEESVEHHVTPFLTLSFIASN